MIIALLVGWVATGLVLALLVAGAVRVAEARAAWEAPDEPVTTDLASAA